MIPREPEANKNNNEVAPETTADITEIEDTEALKKLLAEEKERAEGYLANWQRAQADFINYKRRIEQERGETAKFATAILMASLLPILDDFDRAFGSIPAKLAKLSWVDGIRLIERKLWADLEAQGLSRIEAVGKPFDPNFHEAAMHAKGEEGIVIGELQKGYMLHDRVIRPAMVVVGNGEAAEKKEEQNNG
jgi:molecular chaperone GrpE